MSDTSPTILIVETTAGDPPVEFLGPSSDLVYFISMAHSERYGSQHPLSKAAAVLKRKLKLNITPLLNFGDARADDPEEAALLDRIWQDPAPLAEAALTTAEAVETNPEVADLTAGFPELSHRLRELAEMADWATARGATIRLTYVI